MASIKSMQFNLESKFTILRYHLRPNLLLFRFFYPFFFLVSFFVHFNLGFCSVFVCFHDEISFVNRHIHISTRLNEFCMERRHQIERHTHTYHLFFVSFSETYTLLVLFHHYKITWNAWHWQQQRTEKQRISAKNRTTTKKE